MLPVMTTRPLRELAHPVSLWPMKERENKIIGKKEVKTEYYSESKEITYFVIEKVEEESIVKLIEKMLVNIILTGCNGGLC